MRARTVAPLLVLFLMAVPAQALMGVSDGGAGDIELDDDGRVVLWLKAGAFDPLVEPPTGPSWLHATTTHPYYVVQFDGPVRSSWREPLEALGVRFLQYLPDHAFFARVPRDALDDLAEADHVRYVGPIHPAYRVHPLLIDDLRSPVHQDLLILSWVPESIGRVVHEVSNAGGRVTMVDHDRVKASLPLSTVRGMLMDPSLAIRWIEMDLPMEMVNDNDARTINARQQSDGQYDPTGDSLWSYDPSDDSFEGFTGRNVTVAVADSGLDTSHPAFEGRIVEYFDYDNNGEFDDDGHGTHVAGTVLGNGSWRSSDVGQDGKYAGMAPEALLVVQEAILGTSSGANNMGRDAEGQGATISSNSWISGYFGDYNGQCEAYDQLTHDANNVKPGEQPIFYVFGAGNDGDRGEGSIRPPSLAKNVLSVGSTGNERWGASPNTVSGFSSQGPAEDGRIKPDVLAPGHVVASSRSSYPGSNTGYARPADGQNSYVYASGTSMATPGAAGATAVVTQYIREEEDHEPSPALLKAILINGATPLPGYTYPGNVQGWGRIDLEKSLIETDDYQIYRQDQEVEVNTDPGSDVVTYWFLVRSDQPLKITLTWSDAPGTVNADKHLINDLDLELVDPKGNMYSGNHFSDGHSISNDTFVPDRVNNVEGILVDEPTMGLWNLKVRAHDVPQGSQDYALVVSGNVEEGHMDLTPLGLKATPSDAEEYDIVTLTARALNLGNRDAPTVGFRLERVGPDVSNEILDEGSLGDMAAGIDLDLTWRITGARGHHTFRLTIDPSDDVMESQEDNNVLEVPFFFRGYDVDLTSSTTERTANPGELVTFEMTLMNLGNVADEIGLLLSDPPPGWHAGFTKDSHALGPNGEAAVVLNVVVPLNATAGETAPFSVTAVSSGNSTKTQRVDLQVVVNQVHGVELTTMLGQLDMLPGEERRMEMTVTNTGNGEDEFTLSLPDPTSDWWITLPQVTVEVPARSKKIVTVVIAAPDKALAGTSIEFTVRVVSSMPALDDNVTFSARIVQFHDTQITIVNLVDAGDAGSTIVIPLEISNGGNGLVSYSGDISFPDPSWTGGIDIANMTLAGYEKARANLTFTIPPDAINMSHDFTMVIISSGNEIFLHNFTFSVRQYHKVRVEIVSEPPTVTQGEPAWVRVRLSNEGNGIEGVTMAAETPSSWTFDYSVRMLELAPFDEAIVDLRLNTSGDAPSGFNEVRVLVYYGAARMEKLEVTVAVNVITRPDLECLVSEIVVSEENPYVGSIVRVIATVSNEGETVARDVFVQLYVDGIPVGQPLYLSSVLPGDVETLTLTWTAEASGPREIKVVADYQGEILEPDEENNAATLTVDVWEPEADESPGATFLLAFLALAAVTSATWTVRIRRRRDRG